MIIANLIMVSSMVYTGFYLYKRNSTTNIESIKPKLLLWTPLEPIHDTKT